MANWKEVTERWLPIVEKMEEHDMDDYAIPEIYRAAENEIDSLHGMKTCSLCNIDTTKISFHFGYGSERDGDMVCWECAPKIDALLTKETNDED